MPAASTVMSPARSSLRSAGRRHSGSRHAAQRRCATSVDGGGERDVGGDRGRVADVGALDGRSGRRRDEHRVGGVGGRCGQCERSQCKDQEWTSRHSPEDRPGHPSVVEVAPSKGRSGSAAAGPGGAGRRDAHCPQHTLAVHWADLGARPKLTRSAHASAARCSGSAPGRRSGAGTARSRPCTLPEAARSVSPGLPYPRGVCPRRPGPSRCA